VESQRLKKEERATGRKTGYIEEIDKKQKERGKRKTSIL